MGAVSLLLGSGELGRGGPVRIVTSPSLVRMVRVVIAFGETPANGRVLITVDHRRCGLFLSVVQLKSAWVVTRIEAIVSPSGWRRLRCSEQDVVQSC